MAYTQSLEELERHLVDEILFLTDACAKFDGGQTAYAKVIATSIRKLVHHTSASNALLVQLGVRDEWRWKDTAEEIDPSDVVNTFGLVSATYHVTGSESDYSVTYNPILDSYPRRQINRVSVFSRSRIHRERGTPMRFSYWWNRPIIRDLRRNDFSRRSVVLHVANRDGGAHIDSKVADPFADLTRDGSMALPAERADGSKYVSKASPVPATVRQIGFEVLATLSHYRPELFSVES